MAQDRDQYVYFTIKLLKGSFALNALWQDALNYHMIDQPDKLIALRLTEYYELVAKGAARSGLNVQAAPAAPAPAAPPPVAPGHERAAAPQPQTHLNGRGTPSQALPTGQQSERAHEHVVSAPMSVAEQNAEEAADYWEPL